MSHPRISIITPAFNHAHYLEATLESIAGQGYPELDFVVMDGGSTDGTVQLLEQWDARLSSWASEPDRGQSDALNKGFAQADGAIFGWINSDDLLEPGALAAVAEVYEPGRVLYAGQVVSFVEGTDQEWVEDQDGLTFDRLAKFWEGGSADGWWLQPGIFFNREVWDAAGPLDVGMHLAMDYDFFLKALEGAKVIPIDRPLARFRRHPAQKTSAQAVAQLGEMSMACRRYWGDRFAPFQKPHDAWMARSLISNAGLQLLGGRIGTAIKTVFAALGYSWTTVVWDVPMKVLSAPARWLRRKRRGRTEGAQRSP